MVRQALDQLDLSQLDLVFIENVGNLIYEDLCGAVGTNTRQCNLVGNVIVAGDFDNSDKVSVESWQTMQSPTINLAVRSAAPGTKKG